MKLQYHPLCERMARSGDEGPEMKTLTKIWNRETTPAYLAMTGLAVTATYVSALHGLLG